MGVAALILLAALAIWIVRTVNGRVAPRKKDAPKAEEEDPPEEE
jgi:hypothetical protein